MAFAKRILFISSLSICLIEISLVGTWVFFSKLFFTLFFLSQEIRGKINSNEIE